RVNPPPQAPAGFAPAGLTPPRDRRARDARRAKPRTGGDPTQGAPMRADDLFATITDQLIAAIETGAGEWRMPWPTLADGGTPVSVDGHRYRGVNALWLPMVAGANGWGSGLWATYRGWQRHDGQVRRGEKGTHVLLWKSLAPRPDDADSDGDSPHGRR